jgi:hypothetical protein
MADTINFADATKDTNCGRTVNAEAFSLMQRASDPTAATGSAASAERTREPQELTFSNPYEPDRPSLSLAEHRVVDGVLNELQQSNPDADQIRSLFHKGFDNEAMTRIFEEISNRLRNQPNNGGHWAYHNIPRLDSRDMWVNNFVIMKNRGSTVINIPRSWPSQL